MFGFGWADVSSPYLFLSSYLRYTLPNCLQSILKNTFPIITVLKVLPSSHSHMNSLLYYLDIYTKYICTYDIVRKVYNVFRTSKFYYQQPTFYELQLDNGLDKAIQLALRPAAWLVRRWVFRQQAGGRSPCNAHGSQRATCLLSGATGITWTTWNLWITPKCNEIVGVCEASLASVSHYAWHCGQRTRPDHRHLTCIMSS